MTCIIRRCSSAALLASILMCGAVAMEGREATRRSAAGQPVSGEAQKDGWWIRVSPANEATHLYWRFGAQRNRLSAPISWAKGENPEAFDVPETYRTLDTLELAAMGLPPAAKASFCMFFKDQSVALFEFTGETTGTVTWQSPAGGCEP
jgi:hypothetical protein